MKRKLVLLLALFVPWIAMLYCDKPLAALITLVLQVSVIGWLPASIWAWKEVNVVLPKLKKRAIKAENS